MAVHRSIDPCAVGNSLPKGRIGAKPVIFEGLDEWGAEKNPGAPRTLHDVLLVTDPSSRAQRWLDPGSFQRPDNTESSGLLRFPVSSGLAFRHFEFVFLPATTKLRPPQATGGTSHPR